MYMPCQQNFYARAAINNTALNYGEASVANSRKRLAPIVILSWNFLKVSGG
jgi:hypothetical protein